MHDSSFPYSIRTMLLSALVLVVTATCLVYHPFGPLGSSLWPPSPLCPLPSDAQFPLFAFVALAEASAFGLGLMWLIIGWPYVCRIFTGWWRRSAIFGGIAWHLLNWYPHDSLHMNAGVDLRYMLALELGFHVTLIAVTCAMAVSIAVQSTLFVGKA